MKLYHVSRELYSPGEVICLTEGVNHFSKVIESEGKDWVEMALERQRPSDIPPRNRVQYAFDNPGACLRFANGESRQRGTHTDISWKFYEVEMTAPTRHPIALVDRIYRWGEDEEDEGIVELAREYWNPKENWKRYEYIDTTMRIIGRLDPPSANEAQRDLLWATFDLDTAERLWPHLRARE